MYAYAHTPLDEETIKLTNFSSGDKLFAFIRGFYDLKWLPIFFTKQMPNILKLSLNKVLLLFISKVFYSYQIQRNICLNVLNIYTLLVPKTLNSLLKNLFSCFLKSNFLDMKLDAIQSNPYFLKMQLFTNFPHPIQNFTDHKPLLHWYTKKEILVQGFTEPKCN